MRQVIATVLLGVISSLIAAWIAASLGFQSSSGRGVLDLLLAPVPAVAFFFYTVAVGLLAWGVYVRATRSHRHEIDELRTAHAASSAALDVEAQRLRSALAESQSHVEPRAILARRIVATIQSPPSGSAPTRQEISEAVVKADGNQYSVAEVEAALGWMLATQIVRSNFGRLELCSGWQDRLES
jgi:hypothetical protein